MVAKVEWHPGELYPRVGFIVTNLSRPAERVVAFYNHRGTAEQYIKEGGPGCHAASSATTRFGSSFTPWPTIWATMRTLALPKEVEHWSLTTLREKLVKIGAKVVRRLCHVPISRGRRVEKLVPENLGLD